MYFWLSKAIPKEQSTCYLWQLSIWKGFGGAWSWRVLILLALFSDFELIGTQNTIPLAVFGTENIANKTENTTKKKSRTSEDYDIDRIVIPKEWSENARIEIIKYAEIETPAWKENKNNVKDPGILGVGASLTLEATEDNDLEEDISNEIFMLRHARAEAEEQKRLTSPIIDQSTHTVWSF